LIFPDLFFQIFNNSDDILSADKLKEENLVTLGSRIVADIFRKSDQNSDIKFMQKCKHFEVKFFL